MPETDHKTLSPVEAIIGSIDTDTHVYRWFLLLVLQPSVQARIKNNEDVSRSYRLLKSTMRAQIIAGTALVLSLAAGVILKEPVVLALSVFLVFPAFRLHVKKKRSVMAISRPLLEADPDWPLHRTQTLFKISEQYSRRHKIPSMVDTICFSNRVLRWTILGGFVLTVIVLPFKGIENGLAFLAVYLTVYLLVNSTVVYKHVK